MAQFALVQRARVRTAVRALADELEQLEGPDGTVMYDIPGAPRPAEDTPAPPRLMAMWDSTLLAYADRSRVVPPAYRKHVTRVNGDVLPTLLVDGYVAGVWRPVDGGIEAGAFHPCPTTSGRDWPQRQGRSRRSSRTATPGSTANTATGGPRGCSAAETRLLPGS